MDDKTQPSVIPETVIPQAQTPQESYGKRDWKKWIPIYLVIAAIIYGGVYFLFLSKQGLNPYSARYQAPKSTPQPTQVQDETANWKTYTNSDFGFSIQHPPDWYAKRDDQLWDTNKEYLLLATFTVEVQQFVDQVRPLIPHPFSHRVSSIPTFSEELH